MNVARYARVSTEFQDADDRVSIEQQLDDMQSLIDSKEWKLVATFIDNKKYVKTKAPKKGKRVNPSGEYDDRPEFLNLLKLMATGEIDIVTCWVDDRLVRHPRVAVALEEAWDKGDKQRKTNIQIFQANGAPLDRFTLGIKAQVWREENKRRAERFKMGKVGSLKLGRWPGPYIRFGYNGIKEVDKRGVSIVINPDEAETVQLIFDLADTGKSLSEIRGILLAKGVEQKGIRNITLEWTPVIINRILRCEDYTGHATWKFSDGDSYTIDIPQIIDPAQFKRVQRKIESRKTKSKRNTKAIAALQYILKCGECDCGFSVSKVDSYKNKRKPGRTLYTYPRHMYHCNIANSLKDKRHKNYAIYGNTLDYRVWRELVDRVVKHPELVKEQVLAYRDQLQAEGNNVDGEIASAYRQLKEIEAGRQRLMSMLTKDVITEADFELVMVQRNADKKYWTEELSRLETLRDDKQAVLTELEIAFKILQGYERKLVELDMPEPDFKKLSPERQQEVLRDRKQIIQALCETVTIWPTGDIRIDGLIDVTDGILTDKVQLF